MRFYNICACFLLAWFVPVSLCSQQQAPLRGDVNGNGRLEVGDAQYLLDYFFNHGRALICNPAADINHDSRINITDAIYLLQALFVRDSVTIESLDPVELAECRPSLQLRRGEARFFSPDENGNGLHCGLCHGLESISEEGLDGPLFAGHGLGDAPRRLSYFNGQITNLVGALNQCRVNWMEAPALDPEEEACLEYLAFLDSLGPPGGPVPQLNYQVDSPRISGSPRGDPAEGCRLFSRACESCHGRYGEGGVEGLASSLWDRDLDPDLVRRYVRLSGPRSPTGNFAFAPGLLDNGMPFWTRARMSDTELEDLVTYLEFAVNPVFRACESLQQDPPRLLRSGRFQMIMHGVRGRVEHWSDGTLRLRGFFYDGQGRRDVVVWVYNQTIDFHAILRGTAVSPHLGRSRPYIGEDFEVVLPAAIEPGMFNSVAIWCTSAQSTYGRVRFLGE
ncbi:MAG: DM13 domain-containing protein [Planctomycetota bacterium]|jgi:cytochrome c